MLNDILRDYRKWLDYKYSNTANEEEIKQAFDKFIETVEYAYKTHFLNQEVKTTICDIDELSNKHSVTLKNLLADTTEPLLINEVKSE